MFLYFVVLNEGWISIFDWLEVTGVQSLALTGSKKEFLLTSYYFFVTVRLEWDTQKSYLYTCDVEKPGMIPPLD